MEVRPGNVRYLVPWDPENRSKDFAETWSEVKGGWMGNGDTAVFSVKTHAHYLFMKTGFGHFLEFGASDGLDIAYWDTVKQSPWFGNSIGDVGHD